MNMRTVAIGAVLLAVTACADQPNDWATEPSQTELEAVEDECDGEEGDPGWAFVYTADDGQTLIVDHKGEEDLVGATIEQLACVLFELDVPSSIAARMDSTRALDGVQTGTWDSYTVTWSFHPDTGIDLIIEDGE
jgi:hypothetical protein